jgi:hypothetical protein
MDKPKIALEGAMLFRKHYFFILTGLGLVLLSGLFLTWPAANARAQCGSQASSCKSCHEVHGQDPVNNDGTGWHQSHAFGDFCYICHAGNNQSMDEAAAHTGMVAPLSDINAACQSCHPNDLTERAEVYSTALGVEVSSGPPAPVDEPAAAEDEAVSATTADCPPAADGLAMDDPNLIDYTQRYNEIVLGKKPINVGNAILIGLIGLVAIGGGGFVITREKLVNVSFGDTKKPAGEYPAEVVDMLPALARLKSRGRKSLKNILEDPEKAEKVFGLIEAVVSDDKDTEDQQ